jgi:murein DD-endopeptidase MepM/ murein hydrolase activator NlpD
MELLPAIKEYSEDRPGHYSGACSHFVPKDPDGEFWISFQQEVLDKFSFDLPVADADKSINPFFGFFGPRFHPEKMTPYYFHAGIDFTGKLKREIFPVADGVLEYSGFGVINGKYVMISHPEIKTKDGYVLHSLYMHLRDVKVSFSSYQKMLREISFNAYPSISVSKDQTIGGIGKSGMAGGHTHLHLQFEFRNEKGDIILINPAPFLGLDSEDNLTGKTKSSELFKDFVRKNKEEMLKWGLFDIVNNSI